MAYTSPTWVNNNSPFLSAANLQALTDQVEADQRLSGTIDPTSATPGLLGQTYVNTNTSMVLSDKPEMVSAWELHVRSDNNRVYYSGLDRLSGLLQKGAHLPFCKKVGVYVVYN